jgi:hypothetical protein
VAAAAAAEGSSLSGEELARRPEKGLPVLFLPASVREGGIATMGR